MRANLPQREEVGGRGRSSRRRSATTHHLPPTSSVRIALSMSKSRRVVVTGLGAVTSIGSNVRDFWKALLEGTCGIRPFALFDPSAYRTQTAGQVLEIPDGFLTPAEMRRMSRADRMGLAAAREAIAQSGL